MEKEKCGDSKAGSKLKKKVILVVGVIAGILADGYLRLVSGDNGNLLVHGMMFLIVAVATIGAAYGILHLKKRTGCNRK